MEKFLDLSGMEKATHIEIAKKLIDEMAMQLAEEQIEFAFEGTKKFDHYF